jgi:transcriptional regulator with XRE-family HTH domain
MENLKFIIGENLAELRKNAKLTQLELAEKFGYSDKAISKWEKGITLPDIETLSNLCDFYGVTLDYLTHVGNAREDFRKNTSNDDDRNLIITTCLLVSFVWILATIIYVYILISPWTSGLNYWLIFVWAVPASSLVVAGVNRTHKRNKTIYFWCHSIFIWSLLAGFYLQFIDFNIWPLFILGVPIELSLLLWLNVKPKNKRKR